MQAVCVRLLLLFSVTWTATQEEKSEDDIAPAHFDKRRKQELSSRENIVAEDRQTLKEADRVIHKDQAGEHPMVPTYPESTGPSRTKDGDSGMRSLHVQEYGTALLRNKAPAVTRPVTVLEWWEGQDSEKNPRNVPRNVPADVNYAKARSQGKKRHQPGAGGRSNPGRSTGAGHTQCSAHCQTQLSNAPRIPRDFEGSGYTGAQGRGDNDVSPFSGDGQPFQDIPDKGQTGLLVPGEAETSDTDRRGLGPNETPETDGGRDNVLVARVGTEKEAGAAVPSLGEGSSDLMGSTNFRDLPGTQGNRVDMGSQNAHRGKVELHYPSVPFQGQTKGGGGVASKSVAHNEIPKHGKGSARKATEPSGRNQAALSEKHQFFSRGESQRGIIPPRGLDNEIKNEISSHHGPHSEGNGVTHSRRNLQASRGQNDTVGGKAGAQRRGSWGHRRPHSHRGFSSPRSWDSNDSSDSSSSSESSGR
ncbi:matrix extracellular phosphoglycoprotein [Cavia porcellus]|uniref:matrix extracellular phosphoglycoprotein n=1 Tax=Cavia porcellus TaxID=10141 RepID=UPI002FDFB4B7